MQRNKAINNTKQVSKAKQLIKHKLKITNYKSLKLDES